MTFLNMNRLAVTVVVAAAWSAPMASALIPEGSLDRVGAIYKNVRTIMAPVTGGDIEEGQERKLSDSLMTRCFTECIEQNLSPKECQDYIDATITAAGGHEVGDVQVKIQVPRTPEQFASSYWMVEVPVNIYGKFTCDRNEGQTFYPFSWDDGSASGVTVENVDCQGLSAGECCLAIREYGKSLTTSGYDVNGQCLACFAHQEALIPIVNESTGDTDYLDYVYNDPTCAQEQLAGDEVDSLDVQTAAKIATAKDSLQDFFAGEVINCNEFPQLLSELYDAAVVIHPLSQLIGQLACSLCYGANDKDLGNDQDESDIVEVITRILEMLMQADPARSSKENCVIIYTNNDGNIVDVPKLGGSRADDPFDDDCEDGDEVDPTTGPSCDNDPTLACGDTQYCNFREDTGYACKDYAAPGESCGGFTLIGFQGVCSPDAFCYDRFPCYELIADAGGLCVNYGVNTCSASNDPACESDEYCDMSVGRCKPNVGLDRCCDSKLNNCGFGEEEGTLKCVSQERGFGNQEFDVCASTCTENADCDGGSCEGVDSDGEKFCKPDGQTGDTCGELSPVTCDDNQYCNFSEVNGYECKDYVELGGQCSQISIFGEDMRCSPEATCAPEFDLESYEDIFICKLSCTGDKDCENAFCTFAGFEEGSGRFCKPYADTGEGCNFFAAGPAYEGRCNSETHYCRDTDYCVVADGGGRCQPFRNACTSDTDCDDPLTEWCDAGVGYCKAKFEADNCCIGGNDSMCGDGTVCSKGKGLVLKPPTRRLRHDNSGVDRALLDFDPFFGTFLCRKPKLPTCYEEPQQCGGFAGLQCDCVCGEYGGSEPICVDDPADNCDPKNGGADCIGNCLCPL